MEVATLKTTENFNISRYLPEMARRYPDQPAVVTGVGRDSTGKVIYTQNTFAELDRESDAYAWGLTAYGIERGKRVLLMVRPGLPLISLTFALFKAGCIPILIDPAMGIRNLSVCIEECRPDALIGIERAHLARLIFRNAFRSVDKLVTVGQRWGWGGATLEELRVNLETPFPVEAMRSEDEAAILFTTGSTGVPKGVLYEHGMFNAQCDLLRELYGIEPGEVDMPAFPLFALFNVAMGTTSAIPDLDPTRPAACDPAKVVEIIKDQQVTMTFGSPAIWNKVSQYCLEHGIRLPTLRRVLMAGAPVPLHLHQRFQSILDPFADTYTPYGATESLPSSSIGGQEILDVTAARNDITAGTCVGRPAPGVTMRIIAITDREIPEWDDNLMLPPYQIGEIAVKGAMVTKQYVNRPQSTRLAKIHEGQEVWHRMGDLGYFDDENRLWFYGRKSHRVELSNQCLYTEPCEMIFNQHADVYRSALVGFQHNGETVAAMVIEPEAGRMPHNEADRTRLVEELRALGAQHSMTAGITIILFHPSFPVDIRHNAKIFREKLAVWAEKQVGN
ncbi:MAG: fatty acid CoA ligase family protein [Chloroflexota bacterium]